MYASARGVRALHRAGPPGGRHAQAEARALRHGEITTDHLLLALFRVEDGLAVRALAGLGVEEQAVRAALEPRDADPSGQIPFTPSAKRALELSLREALAIGHNYIGTEHVLLGVARVGEGAAATLLPDLETLRAKVVELAGPLEHAERGRRRLLLDSLPRRTQWEYAVERRETLDADWLNDLGAKGWELVAVDGGTCVFKRRRRLPGSLRAAC